MHETWLDSEKKLINHDYDDDYAQVLYKEI